MPVTGSKRFFKSVTIENEGIDFKSLTISLLSTAARRTPYSLSRSNPTNPTKAELS